MNSLILIAAGCFLLLCQRAKAWGCSDSASWCTSYASQCGNQYVRDNCRTTCKTCPSNAPACVSLECTQICILSEDRSSATCDCENGYKLQPDGKTCLDINECDDPKTCANAGSANRFCVNTAGNYICAGCIVQTGGTRWSYYGRSECCTRDTTATCGRSSNNGFTWVYRRVVSGMYFRIRRWPWMANIIVRNKTCGGSLIARRYVLTAAHCFPSYFNYTNPSQDSLVITLGSQNTTTDNSVHVQVNPYRPKVYPHESYNYPNNDIAIIKLSSDVTITYFVRPVCLGDGEEPKVGEKCYATGYTRFASGGLIASSLQEVDLPIVNSSVCASAYSSTNTPINPDIHICAGYTEGGKDTCQSDSGGPLVCQRCNSCSWYVAGITSFGKGCARAGFYGVYTRVDQFSSWINNIIGRTVTPMACTRPALTDWTTWSSCSATCGVGTRTRTRSCTDETNSCDGKKMESQNCNTDPCGTWTAWTSWSNCPVTCGGGSQNSNRQCTGGQAGKRGCPGNTTRSRNCQTQLCW